MEIIPSILEQTKEEVLAKVEAVRALGVVVKPLFLDATTDTLVRRYSETRRRHPLAETLSPGEGIDREIDLYQRTKTNKPGETVNLAVKHLSEVYAQRMKENKIKRGEYFADDAVLEKEMDECLKPEALAKSLGR